MVKLNLIGNHNTSSAATQSPSATDADLDVVMSDIQQGEMPEVQALIDKQEALLTMCRRQLDIASQNSIAPSPTTAHNLASISSNINTLIEEIRSGIQHLLSNEMDTDKKVFDPAAVLDPNNPVPFLRLLLEGLNLIEVDQKEGIQAINTSGKNL